MSDARPNLAEKRRILQLETLYDLALALQGQRAEQELVDELLERVCTVLDPAAAIAVTRDAYGGPRGAATVGWTESPPTGAALLASPLWRELLTEGRLLARSGGELAGRPYGEMLATPLAYRGVYLSYLAVLDKEARGDSGSSFSADDRRFLDSVAALAGVALDQARQVERLETQRERLAEENEVVRVGGRQPIPVDVRLVAATHQDLEALVAAGRFREDLYYRLKGVEVVLPPLRERRGDIPHLVRAFLEEFCRREGIPTPVFRSDALAVLMAHDFPGNVRELQNLVEGSVSLADAEVDAGLIRSLIGAAAQTSPEPLDLGAMERRHIQRVLKLTGGNKSEAAKILGINRKTLQRKGF